ncbi:MAG: hypothetical protein GWM90_10300, partial [Gemmatimonadetes bacterium]|nr:hypothetical protein [Gemmatimonadota bacterium]NIQ54348.1 hypothetical protein [Gemmatimonadota bacterium]NIU74558.1 hypothetical protein [Gammaproteobacteria bacterium]NIX44493.1 hypothetical protein [Gemmatimonadota bacterium]NIY08723.1 hypothetical protein [Gemmatimonadota bacterium]
DLLEANNDPRLAIYYSQHDEKGFAGSPPALSGAGAWSELADAYGAQDASHAIISCAETQFIMAEAQLRSGGDPAAALAAGIACQEARWDITVPTYSADLETEI